MDKLKDCIEKGYFTKEDILDLFIQWGLIEITDDEDPQSPAEAAQPPAEAAQPPA